MWIHNRKASINAASRTRQQGLAMVEMVIVTPLLLFLILGVAELGRAFYQYNSLTKAVRDGSRYLSTEAIHGTTGVIILTDEKMNATRNLVMYGNQTGGGDLLFEGLTADMIQVTSPNVSHIQVSAAFPYQSMFSVSIPSFGMGTGEIDTAFTLTANSVMRAL